MCGKYCGPERSCTINRRGSYGCRCPSGYRWARKEKKCVSRRHRNTGLSRSLYEDKCSKCLYGCDNRLRCQHCDYKNGFVRHDNICVKTWPMQNMMQTTKDGTHLCYGTYNCQNSRLRRAREAISGLDTLDKNLPIEIYFDKSAVRINQKIFEFTPGSKIQEFYGDSDVELNYLILDPNQTSFGLIGIRNFSTDNWTDIEDKTSRKQKSNYLQLNHASMFLKINQLEDVRDLPNELKFSVFIYDKLDEIKPMSIDFVVRGV